MRSGITEAETPTPSVVGSKFMQAAVYRGHQSVVVEEIAIPQIGPGEVLVRVEACGVCHTDLKKIEHDLLPPPRIYGHETAGTVAGVGAGAGFELGERVALFHHIPCEACFYCRRRLYAQCQLYKRVGITAGYEPAGGGFSQYVRVMDWIVRKGVVRVPDHMSYDEACFVEPVNTCLKAVVKCAVEAGEKAVILGQGPIGLLFTLLLARRGAVVLATDPLEERRKLSAEFGARAFDPASGEIREAVSEATEGRGADVIILASGAAGLAAQAVHLSRPGSRILVFAQTSAQEIVEFDGASLCAQERTVMGCYSADIGLQDEAARLVFEGELPVAQLISHRLPLGQIHEAFRLATHPGGRCLKIIVHPQR